jgi:HEPN domain
VTWQPGRERIGQLLHAGELEQVTADQPMAQLLLDDAGRHLATAATALSSGDLSGAYQLAYDALRKSAASLLAAQGLRATSRGGHIAVQEAVLAQFGSTIRAFRSFGRIRRARNSFEYPSTVTPGPSADDVTDAIAAATQSRQAAMTILEQDLLTAW